jgi:hypothetical protein
MPGMAPIFSGSISLAASSSSDWRSITINRFWNYDSMFIYVLGDSSSYPRVVYDTGSPADYYYSSDEVIWYFTAYRFWFRAVLSGETVGDLPVSGTVNTVDVPTVSSQLKSGNISISAGVETTVVSVKGAGFCDMIMCAVIAATSAEETDFRVYCDGNLAFAYKPSELNTNGFTASTPGVSLLKYAANGYCCFVITKRFSFRRLLELKAYNGLAGQTVSCNVYPSLIT